MSDELTASVTLLLGLSHDPDGWHNPGMERVRFGRIRGANSKGWHFAIGLWLFSAIITWPRKLREPNNKTF
jgi:hypothetical protein